MKNLVVLSGAGVSAESGIKTFRDSDGLWENYPVEEVASIEGWYRNPAVMLQFYNERRRQIAQAEPNDAHRKIAALESIFNTTVVTQNIDNLHERAGSKNIIHLHGEVTKVRPENRRADEDGVIDIGYRDINIGDCDKNGVQLRPHIVWFGEEVPMMTAAIQCVEQADILLVIGSSLAVYPAAGLVHYTRKDCKIFLIDPKPIHIPNLNFTQIQEVASVGMEKFIEILREKENF